MGMVLLNELVEIRRAILRQAESVQQQVQRAVGALRNRDVALARQVRAGDEAINRAEIDIEQECLRAFALAHPLAGDLRFVMAVLRINSDLERIGDKAKTIAKRVLDLAECAPMSMPPSLLVMAARSQSMLDETL